MNKEKQTQVSDYDALVTVLAMSMLATELTDRAQILSDHYMDKISAAIFEKAFSEAQTIAAGEPEVQTAATAAAGQNQEET